MCFTLSALSNLHRWNWDGDRIIHECVVPSSRPAVGRSGKRAEYDIDVREFLVAEHNEVLRRALNRDVPAFARRHRLEPAALLARAPGSFDLRAAVLSAFVAEHVPYRAAKGDDPWQFPDETLFLRSGDCEDRALLLAALLIHSGVSRFNVRVALGEVRAEDRAGKPRRHDHAWVMYKTEAGAWTVVEPFASDAAGAARRGRGRAAAAPAVAEYVPFYLFNDAHLWEVAHRQRRPSFQEATLRRRWDRIDPKFAGDVHRSILTDALDGLAGCPAWLREGLMRHFASYFGAVVDEPDNFVAHAYDSRDHFDNGFIEEGWRRVGQRLARFEDDPRRGLDHFAWAAHGIADFYAHSSWGHFARRAGGKLALWAEEGALPSPPDYAAGAFAMGRFSASRRFTGDPARRAPAWAGQILSGRYAQHGDSNGPLEALCPTPSNLSAPGDRMLLPHHDEIAVDGPKPGKAHKLYAGEWAGQYAEQFALRRDAAVRHIRQALEQSQALAALRRPGG